MVCNSKLISGNMDCCSGWNVCVGFGNFEGIRELRSRLGNEGKGTFQCLSQYFDGKGFAPYVTADFWHLLCLCLFLETLHLEALLDASQMSHSC